MHWPLCGKEVAWFDHIMVFVAVIYPLTMIPQILKIFLEQDASSISGLTYALKFLFIVPWFFYGAVHKSKPIMMSNSLWFITYVAMIVGVVIY